MIIKFIKANYLYLFLLCVMLIPDVACALSSKGMPSTIKTNSDTTESVLAWVLKIAGIGAIAYACVSFARNKLQGQAVDTIVYLIIGLGALLFGVGWWYGESSNVQGFLL